MAFIIDDTTPAEVHTGANTRGAVPRPYEIHPVGSYTNVAAFSMPLIPRSEWVERIKEGHAKKSFLSYHRRKGNNGQPIPSLDQNGQGFCWGHSGTMAQILTRAAMNEPYVRLSAFMVCCIIKNYRDEGGWGAQGADFMAENGVPSVEFWPEKSMKRSNDTAAMRENAKQHRITEGWMDLQAAQYDRNLTEDQNMTALLLTCAVIADFNWWGHSVCLMDPVIMSEQHMGTDWGSLDFNNPTDRGVFAATFGKKGINSWTDSYGDLGEFTLTGTRAHLDGGVAVCVTTPSAN